MKRGGKREGAGRKKSAQTKPIFIRVPLSDYEELLRRCKGAIELFYKQKLQ